MNNIKKIGLTALAGSLVALGSANSGEMSVSGGINATLKFGAGSGSQNTGRSIGADRDVSFTGGGELDNGTTFSMTTTTNDDMGLSASTTTITTPSIGSFQLGSGTGSHLEHTMKKFHKLTNKYQITKKLWLTKLVTSWIITILCTHHLQWRCLVRL